MGKSLCVLVSGEKKLRDGGSYRMLLYMRLRGEIWSLASLLLEYAILFLFRGKSKVREW